MITDNDNNHSKEKIPYTYIPVSLKPKGFNNIKLYNFIKQYYETIYKNHLLALQFVYSKIGINFIKLLDIPVYNISLLSFYYKTNVERYNNITDGNHTSCWSLIDIRMAKFSILNTLNLIKDFIFTKYDYKIIYPDQDVDIKKVYQEIFLENFTIQRLFALFSENHIKDELISINNYLASINNINNKNNKEYKENKEKKLVYIYKEKQKFMFKKKLDKNNENNNNTSFKFNLNNKIHNANKNQELNTTCPLDTEGKINNNSKKTSEIDFSDPEILNAEFLLFQSDISTDNKEEKNKNKDDVLNVNKNINNYYLNNNLTEENSIDKIEFKKNNNMIDKNKKYYPKDCSPEEIIMEIAESKRKKLINENINDNNQKINYINDKQNQNLENKEVGIE